MNVRVLTIRKAAMLILTGVVFAHEVQFEVELGAVFVRGYYNPESNEILVEAPLPHNKSKLFTHKLEAPVQISAREIELALEDIQHNVNDAWHLEESKTFDAAFEAQLASNKEGEWWW